MCRRYSLGRERDQEKRPSLEAVPKVTMGTETVPVYIGFKEPRAVNRKTDYLWDCKLNCGIWGF